MIELKDYQKSAVRQLPTAAFWWQVPLGLVRQTCWLFSSTSSDYYLSNRHIR